MTLPAGLIVNPLDQSGNPVIVITFIPRPDSELTRALASNQQGVNR